jgi:hypothetical protein
MNSLQTSAAFGLLLILLTACGPSVLDIGEERTLDGVKLINPSITDPQDPASFEQAKYSIDGQSRLLLRYETFSKNAAEVRTEDGHKVSLLISPLNVANTPAPAPGSSPSPSPSASPAADPAVLAATAGLKACPLKRNWMMAATWKRAHPFSPQGRWAREGGDYESSECIAATSTDSGFAVFDVTPWFLNYVRGRNQNFGMILIYDPSAAGASGQAVEISGDLSGSFSPRLRWDKSVQIPGTTSGSSPWKQN